jgi:RHS repeat-associated protein
MKSRSFTFGPALAGVAFKDISFTGGTVRLPTLGPPFHVFVSPGDDYRYGFNGKENDSETNSIDFGNRCFDPRVGRWFSEDPKKHWYPQMSPYTGMGNSPLVIIDPDGGDIIILRAPKEVGGLGHAAVLIGNEKDGWNYYSKNGTTWLKGSIGPSNKKPRKGVNFKTIADFYRHPMWEDGYYDRGLYIQTTAAQDDDMREAALESIECWYRVVGSSCIDVCSNALDAGGYCGGKMVESVRYNGEFIETQTNYYRDPIPNRRYNDIRNSNPTAFGEVLFNTSGGRNYHITYPERVTESMVITLRVFGIMNKNSPIFKFNETNQNKPNSGGPPPYMPGEPLPTPPRRPYYSPPNDNLPSPPRPNDNLPGPPPQSH